MLKRFFRLMLNCFCIYIIIYQLRNFYNAKITVLGIICFILSTFALAFAIKLKVQMYRDYRNFVELFLNMELMHKERYKLYFSGDSEKIKEYSGVIEEAGQVILAAGNFWVKEDMISYRKQEYAKEIVSKTKYLLDNIQPEKEAFY